MEKDPFIETSQLKYALRLVELFQRKPNPQIVEYMLRILPRADRIRFHDSLFNWVAGETLTLDPQARDGHMNRLVDLSENLDSDSDADDYVRGLAHHEFK